MQGQKKVRCVVCDDHAALRMGLVAALEAADDIEIVGQAADGSAAIEMISRRRPDVAVVDLHMPGPDGIAVTRAISAKTAAIVYTADENPALADAALEAGALGYVLKRGSLEELTRAVRTVAGGKLFVDPTLVGALLDHRAGGRPSPLTQREAEILQLLANGLSTQAAASQLFLAPATVRSYIENAMQKLDTHSRTAAVATAMRGGLIE